MSPAEPAGLVVLISGRGSNYRALQQAIDEGRLPGRIRAVISDRPGAPGLQHAERAGTDTVVVDRRRFAARADFEQALTIAIDGFAPRWVILAGFMRVLGAATVNHYRGRLLNIHPSLLPHHRGLDTHRRVLEAGESRHGASVHFVTPALDAGPVISQASMPVQPGDDADTLADRLLPLEHRLYPATVALVINHSVELRDEHVHIDNRRLETPLLLDRDLAADGRLIHG